MKRLLILSILIVGCFHALNAQNSGYQIGDLIEEVQLPNAYGQVINISSEIDKGICIIFTNHQCQYARLYLDRISDINEQLKGQGIKLVVIESKIESFEGSTQSLDQFIASNNLAFTYLIDFDNSVSSQFAAQSSPHAFLLKKLPEGLKLIYSGSIDNNSRKPERATKKYLADAIEGLLNSSADFKSKTKAVGCSIDRG